MRAAVANGASRPHLLSAIHMHDASLRNPIGQVSRTVLVNLFTALVQVFKDPAITLRLARAARPYCFSDLGYIAFFAQNVGAMLQNIVDIQSFRQNIWRTELDQNSDPARLRWIMPEHDRGDLDSCVEFSVASYVHFITICLPSRLLPKTVHFRHGPRFGEAVYAELLGCPVRFGASETVIDFSSRQLDLPLPGANAALQQRLIANYEQPMRWLAEGRKHAALSYLYLASELNKSPLKLERLAASFGLTERTLRRKLMLEGFPFRDLLEKVRRDLCDLYKMEDRRSLSEVAELLGYSELSAFTRAHRGWYGSPPSGTLP